MIDTNFFDASNLYRAVLNRKQRPSREFGQLNAALAMVEAIHRFALLPNRANLNLFTEKKRCGSQLLDTKTSLMPKICVGT